MYIYFPWACISSWTLHLQSYLGKEFKKRKRKKKRKQSMLLIAVWQLQWLEAMSECSLPHNINLIDVDGSDFVVLPPFKEVHNSSCMASMYHSSSHCILSKNEARNQSKKWCFSSCLLVSKCLPRMIRAPRHHLGASLLQASHKCSPS